MVANFITAESGNRQATEAGYARDLMAWGSSTVEVQPYADFRSVEGILEPP